MNIFTDHRVLHIIVNNQNKCTNEIKEIIEIASAYEGDVKNRIGFNFPFEKINLKKYKMFEKYNTEVDYVIVYKKGDVLTKKHELLHARYFMDEKYRKSIMELWNSFHPEFQKKVLEMLKKMNYPDRMEILMDEFQAYYFSEQPNFFGKQKTF